MQAKGPDTEHHSIVRSPLGTDRPGELIELLQLSTLPEAKFWRVEGSERHWSAVHDTYTACLVRSPVSLSARWQSRGEERSVGPGHIQLMEPGEVHNTTHVSAPASFLVVWWAPSAVMEAGAELGIRGPIHFTGAQSASAELSRSLEALCAALSSDPNPLAIETRFVEATYELLSGETGQEGAVRQRNRRHPCVRRAIEYLREAFNQSVSLDDLAREARLSKFHFARSFRETTGLPPHQYQSLLRLQVARRHLERGTSVEECAALTGFADGPHLSRAFRKWIGVAPGSWARASKCTSVPLLAGT